MAKNNNLTDFLTDLATTIRTKKGTTALINPQDFSSEISSISGGDQPQLYAPTIAISGNTLTVTKNSNNGSFTTGCEVYSNGAVLVAGSYGTFDLDALIELDGDYTITAKSTGTDVLDSLPSDSIAYHKGALAGFPPLSAGRYTLAATTVGNYALFGGGSGNGRSSAVDAYDTNLTRTNPTGLSEGRYDLAATTVGNYALFGGGTSYTQVKTVDAYDTNLTRTTPTELSRAIAQSAATAVGEYAIFILNSEIDAYDTNLTRTNPTALSVARTNLAATTVGNYALFGGGISNIPRPTVDAYDTNLTRTIPTELSVARMQGAATTVGNYALFGGGNIRSSNTASQTVDAYDTNLTRTIPTALSTALYYLSATTVGDYALFGAGAYYFDQTYRSSVVNAYDTNLTRTIPTELSVARMQGAATTVGNYALFGGGNSGGRSDVVDAYNQNLIHQSST